MPTPIAVAKIVKNSGRVLLIILVLAGCTLGNPPFTTIQPQTWQLYKNPQYGFAFPYPDRWIATLSPQNADGSIFTEPQTPAIEMRGWASALIDRPPSSPSDKALNFTTLQGIKGTLQVQITPQTSTLNLTLSPGKMLYHWRGSAPSQRFADYYAAFYYVVLRYQISPKTGQP